MSRGEGAGGKGAGENQRGRVNWGYWLLLKSLVATRPYSESLPHPPHHPHPPFPLPP